PEALRRLRVQRQRRGNLVARDDAWDDTVGFRGTGIGHERGPGIVVREDAVENQSAVFAEVVVAQTPGEVELGRDAVGRLSEYRALVQNVLQIRPEQMVFARAQPLRKSVRRPEERRGRRIESGDEHVLPVMALVRTI